MSALFEFNSKQMAYGYMTGSFPFKPTRRNSHIYVFYDYDDNAILVKAAPNRQAGTIKKAWEELYNRITKAFMTFHILY